MRNAILFSLLFLSIGTSHVIGQVQQKRKLKVVGGLLVILPDTTLITKRDTVLLLTEAEMKAVRFRESPHLKSARFYDSLSRKASTMEFATDILDWVVKKKKRKEKLVGAVVKSEDVFKPYAGLRIGSIVFKRIDLVEGSVIDTLQKASTYFGKFINRVHRDTRSRIIRQNLLFKAGDVLDPYVLADNERLLRQFKTLRDARIYVSKNRHNPDVVDVVVVTQDRGSIGVAGAYSSIHNYQLDVYDINMLGYARQLQVSYFRSDKHPENGYEITFREPNFLRTLVQGELQYTDNYLRQRTRLTLGRDFLTPEIKYAGGLSVYRTNEKFYFEAYDTFEIPYTENNVDIWAGRSFQLQKRTNIIFAARYNPRKFSDKPFISSDSNSFFYDRTLFLGSISLLKSNFLKSYRIRGFGKTEDIPIGGSISIIAGTEVNEFTDRTYMELDGKLGKYFPTTGYFNLSIALGSFYKRGFAEDGLVKLSSTYFSDLVKLRKTQMRQFIFATYTRGFNRVLDKTINLEGKWSEENVRPLGSERITLGFETVYFMPWYSYGFQFALFHRFDLNLLSYESMLWKKNSLFPVIRVGSRMLNENLVLPGFSVELVYFGKSGRYGDAWEVKLSISIPDLFGTSENFKPRVSDFN